MKNIQNILSLFKNEGFKEKRMTWQDAGEKAPDATEKGQSYKSMEALLDKSVSTMSYASDKVIFKDEANKLKKDEKAGTIKISFAGTEENNPMKSAVPQFTFSIDPASKDIKLSYETYAWGEGKEMTLPKDIDEVGLKNLIEIEYKYIVGKYEIKTYSKKELKEEEVKISEDLLGRKTKGDYLANKTHGEIENREKSNILSNLTQMENYDAMTENLRSYFPVQGAKINEVLTSLVLEKTVGVGDIFEKTGTYNQINKFEKTEGGYKTEGKIKSFSEFLNYYDWLLGEQLKDGKDTSMLRGEFFKIKKLAEGAMALIKLFKDNKIKEAPDTHKEAIKEQIRQNEAERLGYTPVKIDGVQQYDKKGKAIYFNENEDKTYTYYNQDGEKTSAYVEAMYKDPKKVEQLKAENALEKEKQKKITELKASLEKDENIKAKYDIEVSGSMMSIRSKDKPGLQPITLSVTKNDDGKTFTIGLSRVKYNRTEKDESTTKEEEISKALAQGFETSVKEMNEWDSSFSEKKDSLVKQGDYSIEATYDKTFELDKSFIRKINELKGAYRESTSTSVSKSEIEDFVRKNKGEISNYNEIKSTCDALARNLLGREKMTEAEVDKFVVEILTNYTNTSFKFRDFVLKFEELFGEDAMLKKGEKEYGRTRAGEMEDKFKRLQGKILEINANKRVENRKEDTPEEAKIRKEYEKVLETVRIGTKVLNCLSKSVNDVRWEEEKSTGTLDTNFKEYDINKDIKVSDTFKKISTKNEYDADRHGTARERYAHDANIEANVTRIKNYKELASTLKGDPFFVKEDNVNRVLTELIAKKSLDTEELFDAVNMYRYLPNDNDYKGKIEDMGDFKKYYMWCKEGNKHPSLEKLNFIIDKSHKFLELLGKAEIDKDKPEIKLSKVLEDSLAGRNKAEKEGYEPLLNDRKEQICTGNGEAIYTKLDDGKLVLIDSEGTPLADQDKYKKYLPKDDKALKEKLGKNTETIKDLDAVKTKLETNLNQGDKELSAKIEKAGTKLVLTWEKAPKNFPQFFIEKDSEGNITVGYLKPGMYSMEKVSIGKTDDEILTGIKKQYDEAGEDYMRQTGNVADETVLGEYYKEATYKKSFALKTILVKTINATEGVYQGKIEDGREGDVSTAELESFFLNSGREKLKNANEIIETCGKMGITEYQTWRLVLTIVKNWSNTTFKFQDFVIALNKFLPEGQKILNKDEMFLGRRKSGEFEEKFKTLRREYAIIKLSGKREDQLTEYEQSRIKEFEKMANALNNGIRLLNLLSIDAEYQEIQAMNLSEINGEVLRNKEQATNKLNVKEGKFYDIDRIPRTFDKQTFKTGEDKSALLLTEKSDNLGIGITEEAYKEFAENYQKHTGSPMDQNSEPLIFRMILKKYEANLGELINSGFVEKTGENKMVLVKIPPLPKEAYEQLYVATNSNKEKNKLTESLQKGTKAYYEKLVENLLKQGVEAWHQKILFWVKDQNGHTMQNEDEKGYMRYLLDQNPKALVDKIFAKPEVWNGKEVNTENLLKEINKFGENGQKYGKEGGRGFEAWLKKEFLKSSFVEKETLAKMKWTELKTIDDLEKMGNNHDQMMTLFAGLRFEGESEKMEQEQQARGFMEFKEPAIRSYLYKLFDSGQQKEALEIASELKKAGPEKVKEIEERLKKINEVVKSLEEIRNAKSPKEQGKVVEQFLGGLGVSVKDGAVNGGGLFTSIPLTPDGKWSLNPGIGIGKDSNGNVAAGPAIGFAHKGENISWGGGIGADTSGNVMMGLGAQAENINPWNALMKAFGREDLATCTWKIPIAIGLGFDLVNLFKNGKLSFGAAATTGLSVDTEQRMDNMRNKALKGYRELEKILGLNMKEGLEAKIGDAGEIRKFMIENPKVSEGIDWSEDKMNNAKVVTVYNYWRKQAGNISIEQAEKNLFNLPILRHIPIAGAFFGIMLDTKQFANLIKSAAVNPAYLFGALFNIGGHTVNVYQTNENLMRAEHISEEIALDIARTQAQILKDQKHIDKTVVTMEDGQVAFVENKKGHEEAYSEGLKTAFLRGDTNKLVYEEPKDTKDYKRVQTYEISKRENKDIKVYVDESAKGVNIITKKDGTIIMPGNENGLMVVSQTLRLYAPVDEGGGTSREIIVITKDPNFSTQKIIDESREAASIFMEKGTPSTLQVNRGADYKYSSNKQQLFQLEDGTWKTNYNKWENFVGLDKQESEKAGKLSKELPGEATKAKEVLSQADAEKVWNTLKEKDELRRGAQKGGVDIDNKEQIIERAKAILGKGIGQGAEDQLYVYINNRYYSEVVRETKNQTIDRFKRNQNATKGGFIKDFQKAVEDMGLKTSAGDLVKAMFDQNEKNFVELCNKIDAEAKQNKKSFHETYHEYMKKNGIPLDNNIIGVGTTVRSSQDPRVSYFPVDLPAFKAEDQMKLAEKQNLAGSSQTEKDLRAAILYSLYGSAPKAESKETFYSPLAARLARFHEATAPVVGGLANYEKLVEFYKDQTKPLSAYDEKTQEAVNKFVKFVKIVEQAIVDNNKPEEGLDIGYGYKIKVDANLWHGSYAKCSNPTIGINQFTLELIEPGKAVVKSASMLNPDFKVQYAVTQVAVGASISETQQKKTTHKKVPPPPPTTDEGKDPNEGISAKPVGSGKFDAAANAAVTDVIPSTGEKITVGDSVVTTIKKGGSELPQ